MISKQELLEQSVEKFVKFGSRSFTMDELASELGISKKTIYHHFNSKDQLIFESVKLLVANYSNYASDIQKHEQDPIVCVVLFFCLIIPIVLMQNSSYFFHYLIDCLFV